MKKRKRSLNRASMKSSFYRQVPFVPPVETMLIAEGFIKVHLTGKTIDQNDLDETIHATKYEQDKAYYQNAFTIDSESNGRLSVNQFRFADFENNRYIHLHFTIDGQNTSNEFISLSPGSKTNSDRLLPVVYQFEDTDLNPNPQPIINLKFDPFTHDISGELNFTMRTPSPLNLSGEFKMKMLQRGIIKKVILCSDNEYPF